MWLYLPLILVLFGFHSFVLPIDGLFPMMLVNGVVWWFLIANLIGFFLFRRWYKRQAQENGLRTFLSWSAFNVLAMLVPLILFLMVQYIPLFTAGFIPFVGPGGVLANFTMSLFHILGVLLMIVPISTWFYQLTGKIYLGAVLNAAIVAWMFTSAQVFAPIPV